MTNLTAHSNIKIFSDLAAPRILSPEEREQAVSESLALPWVKRLLVYAEQVAVLIDLKTSDYLYVSPSVKAISGYTPEEFTGFVFRASLMTQEELNESVRISEIMMGALVQRNLRPEEMLRVRSARTCWLRTKDGRQINTLELGFPLLVDEESRPHLQIVVVTDITRFNNSKAHFYSLTIANEDGRDDVIVSGTLDGENKSISSREREVLHFISHGLTSEAIATKLNISAETVKTHRKHLLEKTKSKTSIDLVRYAFANGWLP